MATGREGVQGDRRVVLVGDGDGDGVDAEVEHGAVVGEDVWDTVLIGYRLAALDVGAGDSDDLDAGKLLVALDVYFRDAAAADTDAQWSVGRGWIGHSHALSV